MPSKILRICLTAVLLFLMAACFGGSSSDDYVSVSIQAEFEKRTITTTGLSSATIMPARYCWVEGFDPQTNDVYFEGYLNPMGQGVADVPRDANFKVRLIARYEVPGNNIYGNFRMRGSVKYGAISDNYNNTNAFNAIPDWDVISETYSGNQDLNITIRALDSTREREAGAFNIAYQAVEFASKMAVLEPSLDLPNLHSFWSPVNHQYTDYPRVAYNPHYTILAQSSGRTIFQHRILGVGNSQTQGRGDEYNDSALMESFARMLFADYSYPSVAPSHSYGRIVRRDSEEAAWVARHIASDSTTAFVNGFCDFISAAFINSPYLIDISDNAINSYNLNSATTFSKVHGGEFYRQSVAAALYRIWVNGFDKTASGLQTMWGATYKNGMAIDVNNSNYPHGYMQCPVGNISSYLSGLANGSSFGVTPSVWNSVRTVLSSEYMGDPNANYFNQGTFWERINSFPATVTGLIRTYPHSEGIFWDYDQAISYHFTQNYTGNRRITLEMTGGQDLFLELFDDSGILEERTNTNNSLAPREINSNLKPGNYVVRVRAGNTTQDRWAGFRLVVQ